MTRQLIGLLAMAATAAFALSCSDKAPEPYGPTPTPSQVEWQKMETNMFMHFGPNTFSGLEWGLGTETEDMFNPTDLNCRQWAATAKAAGFKGIIITAKHHDGFCLWPNPVSKHTVAQSSWRDGKGDVLKDLSEACAEYGVKFGVYTSPWDRHDPHYGTPEYNDVFDSTLIDVHTKYGDIFEQWFDGACGEGPNGKRQVYDFDRFNAEVYKYHPNATIFSDIGPGCRWVGNESGHAGKTCWSTLNIEGFTLGQGAPSADTLNVGNVHGACWMPAETDVSIRPGWFWRESENDQVKSLSKLLKIWYESVGRNSLMLLNVPPDSRGHIYETDSTRLMEFRAALDKIFATNLAAGAKISADNSRRGAQFKAANMLDDDFDTYWASQDGVTTPTFTVNLPSAQTFNRILLQEYIPLGQRVSNFAVDIRDENGEWKEVAVETTIGYKRVVIIPTVTTDAVRVRITGAFACPVLNSFGLYMDDICDPAFLEYSKEPEIVMETTAGNIELKLYNQTPRHRDNFYSLVKEGAYDSLLFHRVIKDFMIQGGDPDSKNAAQGVLLGEGDRPYTVPAEFRLNRGIYHRRGVLAAAREGDDVNPEQASSAMQFYIVWGKTFDDAGLDEVQTRIDKYTDGKVKLTPEMRETYKTVGGTPHLDGRYTVFGEVTKGLDVVDAIQQVQTDSNDRPLTDIRIIKAYLK